MAFLIPTSLITDALMDTKRKKILVIIIKYFELKLQQQFLPRRRLPNQTQQIYSQKTHNTPKLPR